MLIPGIGIFMRAELAQFGQLGEPDGIER